MQPQNIPRELTDLPQWVGRNEAKEPINLHTGRRASSTDRSTWATFDQAAAVVASGQVAGLGFVLTNADPFAFIDLDVAEGEQPTDEQNEILAAFAPSYAEWSPSGRGLHIIVRGAVPKGRRRGGIEIYSSDRYMTMTGNVFRPGPIVDCSAKLASLWEHLGRNDPGEAHTASHVVDPTPAPPISDERLVELVCGSPANAAHYNGTSDANWSDAYFALGCATCLFSSDEAQVRRVVIASPLVQNGPPAANGETRPQKAARLWASEYARAAARGAQERQQQAQATAHGAQEAARVLAASGQPAARQGATTLPAVIDPLSRVRSARDLQYRHFDPLKVVIDYVVEGLTFIASVPKLGKSWEALLLALAKAQGGEFRGTNYAPGDVFLLALEDNERRLQDRVSKITGSVDWPRNLEYATEWPRLDEGGFDAIQRWVESKTNPALVVIDTLAMVKPRQKTKSSVYDFDVDAIKPLQKLAIERRFAILVVTHTRKEQAEDPVESVSSTLGLTGVADTVVVMKRGPNKGTAVMYGRGRDISEFERGMRFDNFRWIDEGAPKEVFAGDTQKLLIEAIRNGATTPKDMETATGLSGDNVRQTLQRMTKNQIVFRSGYGQYELAGWMTGKPAFGDALQPSQVQPNLLPP